MEKKWFLLSITSLGLGGFLAFVVAMARTPGIYEYFPPNYFYHALTGHVDLAIVVFLLAFTVLIWNRTFGGELQLSFYLATVGFVGIALSSFLGKGQAVSNNYLPTIVHPIFFLGAISFFMAFWIETLRLLKEAVRKIFSPNPLENSAATSVALGFLILVATIFSSFRVGSHNELYKFYERLYWAPGHIHQFLNGAILLYAWYLLINLNGEKVRLGKLRYLSAVFLVFGVLLSAVPIIFSDPISYNAKLFTEIAYAIGLGIPMFIHAFNVIKNLKLNWKNVYSFGLILSLVLYFLGVAIAYLGIKADLRVPAHYHGTVTSLTLALMVFAYYLVVEYGWKKKLSNLINFQVYLYGVGMILFILGLYFAGSGGAPRKTYGTEYTDNPFVLASLALMGFGTVMAVLSGILFVTYILNSWYNKGERR